MLTRILFETPTIYLLLNERDIFNNDYPVRRELNLNLHLLKKFENSCHQKVEGYL